MDKLVNVLAMIIGLAMVTTVVSRPESARVVTAFGDAFRGSIRAALRD